MKIEKRYLDGTYLSKNPDWDRSDSPWKAKKILDFIQKQNLNPKTVCEVGCGIGDILDELASFFPTTSFYGFDISPQLPKFWTSKKNKENLAFSLGEFHRKNKRHYDLILMIDVFEHLRDPFTFLEDTIPHADYFLFHIPLDLNALSIVRGTPLIKIRKKVGHLQYYTKDLAIETLIDCGYRIIAWEFSDAFKNIPNPKFSTRLGLIPRMLLSIFSTDLSARIFGGQTLFVLATKN